MEQTKISILLTMDEAIHEHSATFNYDEDKDEDVNAYEVLKHFLYLCQHVYGELATQDAMEKIKQQW